MELPVTNKLQLLPADKQDELSTIVDPAFSSKGISEPWRPTSSARAYVSTNILTNVVKSHLRYTLIVSERARGKRSKLVTFARCVGANITPTRHTLWQLIPANTAERRGLEQVYNCLFHEISASMAAVFNAIADEQFTSPHMRRLLSSHREKARNAVNPEAAMARCWNPIRHCSSPDDVWRLGRKKRQRQRDDILRLMPLCVPGGVGSSDTAVATAL